MTGVRVTYLSMDSLDEGVGASQVLAYVERLGGRGVGVELHTFEKGAPSAQVARRLADSGVDWRPHPFGRYGSAGGVARIRTAAAAARRAPLVHARGDLAAAAAIVGRPRRWIWDVRALFADQRIALGTLVAGSAEHRLLRRVEGRSARSADGLVTLTRRAVDELECRHQVELRDRTSVITTCVDLGRFRPAPPPPDDPLVLLLAGTVNAYYDVPTMVALADAVGRRRRAELHLLTPGPTAWDEVLAPAVTVRRTAAPAEVHVALAAGHVGLSVCREDAGPSLAAAMPTKIGEFLALGRPVVVNPSLGDAAELVRAHGVGVLIGSVAEADVVADELLALLEDPQLPGRCRALAEEHFDLERGVDRLVARYAAAVA